MSEQVQLVDILQTDDWNKSEQSRDGIETNALNDKLAEIRYASKKRDKAFLALTIMLLICFSLAVIVIVVYLEGKRFYFLLMWGGRTFSRNSGLTSYFVGNVGT